jgi:hypothetical protein
MARLVFHPTREVTTVAPYQRALDRATNKLP